LNAIRNSLNTLKTSNQCNNCGEVNKNVEHLKSVEMAYAGFEESKLYENSNEKIGSTNSNESLSSE